MHMLCCRLIGCQEGTCQGWSITPDLGLLIRCLEAIPVLRRDLQSGEFWQGAGPCIAVAPLHPINSPQHQQQDASLSEAGYTSAQKPQWAVQIYSLQTQSYIHSLTVASAVLALRCSCRVLAVALDGQVCPALWP